MGTKPTLSLEYSPVTGVQAVDEDGAYVWQRVSGGDNMLYILLPDGNLALVDYVGSVNTAIMKFFEQSHRVLFSEAELELFLCIEQFVFSQPDLG